MDDVYQFIAESTADLKRSGDKGGKGKVKEEERDDIQESSGEEGLFDDDVE